MTFTLKAAPTRCITAALLSSKSIMPPVANHSSTASAVLQEVEGCSHLPYKHRNVSGGALRAATFGALDGLLSNTALIVGVLAAHQAMHIVLIAAFAGLAGGALSMATGEFISVSTQNELIVAEVEAERNELLNHPERELLELAAAFVKKGLSRELSFEVAKELHKDPEVALKTHAIEELGVDPKESPSAVGAAFASFSAFSLGAFLPIIPLFFAASIFATLLVSGISLLVTGILTAKFNGRSLKKGAARHFALGTLAFSASYFFGDIISMLLKK